MLNLSFFINNLFIFGMNSTILGNNSNVGCSVPLYGNDSNPAMQEQLLMMPGDMPAHFYHPDHHQIESSQPVHLQFPTANMASGSENISSCAHINMNAATSNYDVHVSNQTPVSR